MTGTPDYPAGCPWRDLAEVPQDRPQYRRDSRGSEIL